jgi:hypothetical protein
MRKKLEKDNVLAVRGYYRLNLFNWCVTYPTTIPQQLLLK